MENFLSTWGARETYLKPEVPTLKNMKLNHNLYFSVSSKKHTNNRQYDYNGNGHWWPPFGHNRTPDCGFGDVLSQPRLRSDNWQHEILQSPTIRRFKHKLYQRTNGCPQPIARRTAKNDSS